MDANAFIELDSGMANSVRYWLCWHVAKVLDLVVDWINLVLNMVVCLQCYFMLKGRTSGSGPPKESTLFRKE